MDDAQDLADLVRAEVARQQAFQIMVVNSVREDGTVNLQWGEEVIDGVACNRSYTQRKDGDVVLVLRHTAGWRVIDAAGPPATFDPPPVPDITFGPPSPDASFVPADQVWVKDGAMYAQTGSGPGGPGETPVQSVPKPATISPTARAGYRSGSRDGSSVRQGAWSSYPKPWAGAWFYEDRIQAACAGVTVERMEIRVARTSARHGVSGKVRPRLGLHDYQFAPSRTPGLDNRWTGPGLGLGQSVWVTIPTSEAEELAAGARRGVGISAGVGSEYLVTSDSCGEIRITYK